MTHPLTEIGILQRSGVPAGIVSVCSSENRVLETALAGAGRENGHLAIEATCNQVNQYGGYTGMTPGGFVSHVRGLAGKAGFPDNRLVIGGDHLGPYPWRRETAEKAMEKAERLVKECVSAGYGKIHLDCGMPLGDDSGDATFVDPEVSAKRSARLCRAAESAVSGSQRSRGLPLYVIGAEAPTPGGSLRAADATPVTEPDEIAGFLSLCQDLFRNKGLADAWERVVGVVVQPGIDFGPDSFVPYDPNAAAALSRFHDRLPGRITFEVHSTDFQDETSLAEMVRDHFALLKTGPVLTFAFREAVFALSHIEEELFADKAGIPVSGIRRIIDREMTADPVHWRSHVPENDEDVRIHRIYGFTDRIRYYWQYPAVRAALDRLMTNLDRPVPLSLVSQYFPEAFRAAAAQQLPSTPESLVRHRISGALAPYFRACRGRP